VALYGVLSRPCGSVVVVIVGGGVPDGVTPFDGVDSGPLPTAFVAWTVNVYVVPFVSPVTVRGLDGPEAVKPPGLEVTVYEVIGLPPSEAGGLKLIVACPLPAVAVTAVGAPGAVAAGLPQFGNRKDPIRVLQLNVPSALRYSPAYQNVQSSDGSIVMLL
jgi:hypothetical protein